ncbi:MAG: cytochrome c biogenesis protein CcdA [Gallionella sp.]
MGGADALWGGFSSFFSIWQICILQISPFFIAFAVGLYLAMRGKSAEQKILLRILFLCIAYGIGFTVFYALLIASGLSISRPLIHNIGLLRVISGIVILLAGLHIILVNRISFLGKMHSPLLLGALSLLIGVAFAFIYSPCITPMLSDIMGLASQRSTAAEGGYLAFWYGLGISIALCMVAVALIILAGKREVILRNAGAIKNICGIILLVLGGMNLTGLMTHYKAFVLGFVL